MCIAALRKLEMYGGGDRYDKNANYQRVARLAKDVWKDHDKKMPNLTPPATVPCTLAVQPPGFSGDSEAFWPTLQKECGRRNKEEHVHSFASFQQRLIFFLTIVHILLAV